MVAVLASSSILLQSLRLCMRNLAYAIFLYIVCTLDCAFAEPHQAGQLVELVTVGSTICAHLSDGSYTAGSYVKLKKKSQFQSYQKQLTNLVRQSKQTARPNRTALLKAIKSLRHKIEVTSPLCAGLAGSPTPNQPEPSPPTSTPTPVNTPVRPIPNALADRIIIDPTYSLNAAILLQATQDDSSAALDYLIVQPPTEGTLSGSAPNLTYTLLNEEAVSDWFTFQVSKNGVQSALARIDIEIAPSSFSLPQASEIELTEASPSQLNLQQIFGTLAEDSFIISSAPQHGTLSGESNAPTYSTIDSYLGRDHFTVTITRGRKQLERTVALRIIALPNTLKSYNPAQAQYALNLLKPNHPRLLDYTLVQRSLDIVGPQNIDSCNSQMGDDPTAHQIVCAQRGVVERQSSSSLFLRAIPSHPNPNGPPQQYSFTSPPTLFCELYRSSIYNDSSNPNQQVRWIELDSSDHPVLLAGAYKQKIYSAAEFRALLPHFARKWLLHYSDPLAYPNWGNSNGEFLDEGSVLGPISKLYDCFYDQLSEQDRAYIRAAMIRNALSRADDCHKAGMPECWWMATDMNQAADANKNILAGALAIMEDEPDLSSRLILHAVADLANVLSAVAPDGGSKEGLGYHSMTFKGIADSSEFLTAALGTDFGVSNSPGVSNAALYNFQMIDPTGLILNYGETQLNTEALGSNPTLDHPSWTYGLGLWTSLRFGKPLAALMDLTNWPRTPLEYQLLYYDRNWQHAQPNDLPLDSAFYSAEVTTMRSSHYSDALYLACNGGNHLQPGGHFQLDAGSFILGALGQRFAIDLGNESYSIPHNYELYRRSAYGHNVVLLGDRSSGTLNYKNQTFRHWYVAPKDRSSFPHEPITQFSSHADQSSATFDLTLGYDPNIDQQNTADVIHAASALPRDLESYKRGCTLINNRQNALIVDELSTTNTLETTWQMHTTANVTNLGGGSMLLEQDGKLMRLDILEPVGVTFYVTDLEVVPSTGLALSAAQLAQCTARYVSDPLNGPTIQGTQPSFCPLPVLPGTKRINAAIPQFSGNQRIVVAFTPSSSGTPPRYTGSVAPLANWIND